MTEEALAECGVGPRDKALVALSGGADSTALLLSMKELLSKGAIAGLFAAHLHHGIRREGAERDLEFCKSLCERLAIPFSFGRADAPGHAEANGKTLEEAARDLRYAFLERERERLRADVILTAHHANDQAETVLMHLLRGCGTAGLGGMHPRTGRIARPLLGVSKAQILAYLGERGQDYCRDETNADVFAQRNRVRIELMPFLEQVNPSAVEALCRTAELCAADEALLDRLSREAEERILSGGGLDRAALIALDGALASRIVKRRVFALGGNVSEADITRVLAVCGARTGTAIELGGGFSAWTDAETLLIGRYPKAAAFEMPFVMQGETKTLAGAFISEYAAAFVPPESLNEAFLDADALPKELVVRSRREGDRLWPLGAPGERKLSDVLTDRKIPREKRGMPLLCAGKDVFYAAGVALSERAKVTPETKKILHILYTGGTDS